MRDSVSNKKLTLCKQSRESSLIEGSIVRLSDRIKAYWFISYTYNSCVKNGVCKRIIYIRACYKIKRLHDGICNHMCIHALEATELLGV